MNQFTVSLLKGLCLASLFHYEARRVYSLLVKMCLLMFIYLRHFVSSLWLSSFIISKNYSFFLNSYYYSKHYDSKGACEIVKNKKHCRFHRKTGWFIQIRRNTWTIMMSGIMQDWFGKQNSFFKILFFSIFIIFFFFSSSKNHRFFLLILWVPAHHIFHHFILSYVKQVK